ncbi:SUMO specific peptidase 6 S homeolog [Xenopus laevis]|uniref:Sentrin-specific protease 6 n=1 Tax=Xenopus laevis TaxID=8355 RepID=B7TYL1_XENLA|nr:SUMO specific peptidase 6 S homeolog [Xenopus laevis]ACJ46049.1 sentrin/SUMO-specific protease 6 [Xenopus laevis]
MAGGGGSQLLEALDRSQSRKDGGFSNCSFYNSEDSEDDTEKDEANLLSLDESDDADLQITEQKPKHLRSGTARALGDSIKTYERRGRTLHFTALKGNAIGLNMLGASKKLGENAQNIPVTSGTIVQGRIFHHTNIPRSTVKTAAQRKEYPAHVQKVDSDQGRLHTSLKSENVQERKEDSNFESEPEKIKRKAQQRRHSSVPECDMSLTRTPQMCLTLPEGVRQAEELQFCTVCVKENKKTKCQSTESSQRLCKQPIALNELSPLPRPAIHQIDGRTAKLAFNVKSFYSSTCNQLIPNDFVQQYPANGKLASEGNTSKAAKNMRLRSAGSSEPNDPIVLSSDDEDNASTGSTNRIESISPRPADSACSSPAPSSGKVEAALKENSFTFEHKFCNSAIDAASTIALPRKAKMKDQFGNTVSRTPVKRRKVFAPETPPEPAPDANSNCESLVMNCRSVRIGSYYREAIEHVVFSMDFITIRWEVLPEDGNSQELVLYPSELTKCEWCAVRKLPVVFFQTLPAACQSLRSRLKLSRENGTGWYDCRATNLEEQFIVLIFENAPDMKATVGFETILYNIGIKNGIKNFFIKIPFEDANGRLVAFTKNSEDIPVMGSTQKENIEKNAATETRMKLRNSSQLQFFGDDEGDTHTVFVGPVEKLIVYPPPPAKGGISVTNEDLHCLNEGEFLNDVIIDFYLKYLVLEKLRKDADRIHIFSSFFYKRLNQRERRNLQPPANLTLQQRRHGRVKTWTRHVDIFQKDFIFVPLNEAAHWFLAVICFPGLEKPEHYPNPYYQGVSSTATVGEGDNTSASLPQNASETTLQGASSNSPLKKTLGKNTGTDAIDTLGPKRNHSLTRHRSRKSDQGLQEEDVSMKPVFSDSETSNNDINGATNECKTPVKPRDGLHRIQISYTETTDDTKKSEDEFIDFSDDQDNMDECSDDASLTDENYTSEAGKWHLKQFFCKQPCILLMDSLRGPSRSTVVKTLREYLEVEWEVRKGSKRSFSKDVMKGSSTRVPQQNNLSDCGVYILQYVESFFENPIQSFDLPMNLMDWFPQQRMKTKREEICNLILTLQGLQSKEKKGNKEPSTMQHAAQEKPEPCISSGSD